MVVRRIKVHGRVRFMVDGRIAGKRLREVHDSRAAAENRLAELQADLKDAGQSWQALTPAERRVLADLHHAATSAGTSLSTVWHEWRGGRSAAGATADGVTLLDGVTRFLAVKEQAKLSPRSIQKIRWRLNWLVTDFGPKPVAAVTHQDVTRILEAHPAGSWNTTATVYGGFFSWVIRQGWRTDNPLHRIERRRETARRPDILTPEEARRCLRWITTHRPNTLAWFVLTTFCGLRPEEALQTEWPAIRLDEGLVMVEAQTTKTRQRRIVYPLPSALDWLKHAQRMKATLPLNRMLMRRTQRALAEELGWPGWKRDVTRHSAASYWLASSQDAHAVAVALGHSEAILHRHYKALVTRAQAEEWLAIRPGEDNAKASDEK